MEAMKTATITTMFSLAMFMLATQLSGCSQPAEAPAPSPAPVEIETALADDHGHEHDSDEMADDHGEVDDDHGHTHDDEGGHGHHHEAPRGGTLIALGDHMGHFEVVLDADTGRFTVYALDGHVENPVRMEQESFTWTLRTSVEDEIEVTLAAVANPLTGETVGDTSQFEVVDERLQGLESFQMMIPAFEFRGIDVSAMHVPFPEGNE